MTILIAFLLAGVVEAPPAARVAVAPMQGGDGASEGMVSMLSEAFLAELRRQSNFELLARAELKAILSYEELNQLIGCSDDSCLASLGNAAGAQGLVAGSVGKVGDSWVVALKIIDVQAARVIASADRRIKGGSQDDILDLLPSMTAELLEKARGKLAPASPIGSPLERPQSVAVTGLPLPRAHEDRPYADSKVASRLMWVTDGKGAFIAFDDKERQSGPLFAGTRNELFAQRIGGGGASGREEWSVIFWEPRVTERWRGGFAMKGGAYTLQCGTAEIPFTPVSAGEAKKLAKGAKLFDVRWQRAAIQIARDDRGNYYYVDQARTPENNSDYRLFVGTKGSMKYLEVTDAIVDASSSIFLSQEGRLIIRRDGDKESAVWAVGDSERPLTVMNLFQQAPMVYTKLGVYAGQPLGTPCDSFLK